MPTHRFAGDFQTSHCVTVDVGLGVRELGVCFARTANVSVHIRGVATVRYDIGHGLTRLSHKDTGRGNGHERSRQFGRACP
jgi:hypothetical protein